MITTKEKYGCDADGNRGVYQKYAELEENDIDWIYEQIVEQFDEDKKYYTVSNEDEDGCEFEFEVYVRDWLSDQEYLELKKEFSED